MGLLSDYLKEMGEPVIMGAVKKAKGTAKIPPKTTPLAEGRIAGIIDSLERVHFSEDAPVRTVGYRYGKAPESGYSWNAMDNRNERGVSMAAAAGSEEKRSFAISDASANRSKYYYEGDLIGTGGDDEPIFANVRRITAKEYRERVASSDVLKHRLQWEVNELRRAENILSKGYDYADKVAKRRDKIKSLLENNPELLPDQSSPPSGGGLSAKALIPAAGATGLMLSPERAFAEALQEPTFDPTTLLAGPARWGGGLLNMGVDALMRYMTR